MVKTSKKPLSQYITAFAGDLQYMAGDAHSHGNIETGGGLYGLWSHSGRPVIMLATPSGPGACNETAHFAVDTDYVTRVNGQLQKRFGIQYLGNWHSHHSLGMDHPSRGDVGQIHRVAGRNNIPRMVQIVLTHEGGAIVRVNAFIYAEAPKGPYTRCPLKILPDQSPIRTALAGSDILCTTGKPHLDFPLERIVYDAEKSSAEPNDARQSIPSVLVEQLGELPDEIAGRTEIYPNKDVILISLPSLNDYRICIAYKVTESHLEVHSVHLVRPNTKVSVDITKDVPTDNGASLSLIYERSEERVRCDKQKDFVCGCQASAGEFYRIERM